MTPNNKRFFQKPSIQKMINIMGGKVAPFFLRSILSMCLWLVCLSVAWQWLSYNNFYYSSWYEVLDIRQTINTYSPQNRSGKQHFIYTDKKEHQRLFSRIVVSINNNGEGLESIAYHLTSFNTSTKTHHYPLLTPAEVIHLQDVANLISVMKIVVLIALVVGVAAGTLLVYKNISLPSLKKQCGMNFLWLILFGWLVILIGAEDFFNYLHEIVFPGDHQWFFYYQDSLMSTMMQAPNIFAPIAVLWVLLSALLWGALMALWLSLWRNLSNKKPDIESGF